MNTFIQKGVLVAFFMMCWTFTTQAEPCSWKEFEDGSVASAEEVNCNFNLLDLNTSSNKSAIINFQSRIDQSEADLSDLDESTQKNR